MVSIIIFKFANKENYIYASMNQCSDIAANVFDNGLKFYEQ